MCVCVCVCVFVCVCERERERERESNHRYIHVHVADDMGLGKTLSIISLVIQRKDEDVEEWLAKPPAKEGERHSQESMLCVMSKV